MSGPTFAEIKGDLFSVADDVSLAHCISRDASMSKGIAVPFANKFHQREAIRSNNYLYNKRARPTKNEPQQGIRISYLEREREG
jgi:hypothetical protein